jgi:hypothetical protein
MSKIEKFGEFTNEGLKELAAKMRRTVTGESAGDEIEKLTQEQQQQLIDMYRKDPTEAAKYLRSIIIKEKNSQFGLGLALAIAGSGMIYKAANVEPPKPKPDPDIDPEPVPPPPVPTAEDYVVQKGDSWWAIAKDHLPSGSSNKDILAYAKQIASENGAEHLYSGKYGSPGLDTDTWYDLASGKEVGKDVITSADRLRPGEVIKISDFAGGDARPGVDATESNIY